MSSFKWIAIYTKVNQEQLALDNIRRQSYEGFCPMVSRIRRHARKTDYVKRPLFPGYVFTKLNVEKDQWRPLLSTRGVQSLVKFGSQIGFLPQGFIDELKLYEQNGMLESMAAPKIQPGDNVEILDGPFRSVIAKVLSLPDKDRCWLLLDMMGQQVRISQKVSALLPA